MFDGVAGIDRGDVDREEDGRRGPDPDLAVEPERREQRVAGEQLKRPGAELGDRRRTAAARIAEDHQAAAHAHERAADRGDHPRDPAGAACADDGGREHDRDQQEQRREAEDEQPLGARVEEVGRRSR